MPDDTPSIIGREDKLMEGLAKLAHDAIRKRHEYTNLRKTGRGYTFDVGVCVDDEPTGYVARITVELVGTELTQPH